MQELSGFCVFMGAYYSTPFRYLFMMIFLFLCAFIVNADEK